MTKAFPDLKATTPNTWGVGDFVIAEGSASRAPTRAAFIGIQPTKKSINLHGLDIIQFKDGKVVKGTTLRQRRRDDDAARPHAAARRREAGEARGCAREAGDARGCAREAGDARGCAREAGDAGGCAREAGDAARLRPRRSSRAQLSLR